jgi:FAD/FMN-containing dehydrogenase
MNETMTTVSTAPPPMAHGLDDDAITALRETLSGRLITPADPDYDRARAVWNGMIDRYPALIASCATTADVVAALRFARVHDLLVAVRGGGHSAAGHSTCDGGMVIDCSPLESLEVDADARIASAGAGVTWGEMDAATQPFGLAAPGGVFSRTGIAGLTLGGGYGWLAGTYGLACDNLIAAEVVTADGEVVVADDTGKHAELMWGLRGGGGNFGIVTRFTYRLHPVGPESYFAVVFHDGEGEETARALRFYRDYCATAPDAVNLIAVCGVVPDEMEGFPAASYGKRFVLFGAHYVGPVEEGERVTRPLRELAAPIVDFSAVVPFLDVQRLWEHEYPDGMRYYWKSVNLTRFDDDVIARIVDHARRQVSPLSTTDIWHVGGGIKRANRERSAFRGRDAAFLLGLEANWVDAADDAANIAWAREFTDDMEAFSDGSRYLNFAGFQEEGEAMMRGTFGPDYERLAALKRRYDPTNVFRLNQNIAPE